MSASLKEIAEQVVPVLSPYARWIALFGSQTSGEAGDASDVDILVDLKPPGERPPLGLRWYGLERELSERLGRSVDLVSNAALSPHLRPHIEPTMVVLYAEG